MMVWFKKKIFFVSFHHSTYFEFLLDKIKIILDNNYIKINFFLLTTRLIMVKSIF